MNDEIKNKIQQVCVDYGWYCSFDDEKEIVFIKTDGQFTHIYRYIPYIEITQSVVPIPTLITSYMRATELDFEEDEDELEEIYEQRESELRDMVLGFSEDDIVQYILNSEILCEELKKDNERLKKQYCERVDCMGRLGNSKKVEELKASVKYYVDILTDLKKLLEKCIERDYHCIGDYSDGIHFACKYILEKIKELEAKNNV